MENRTRTKLSHLTTSLADAAIGLVPGTLLAFFFVFRTLFTDGPGSIWHPEYLMAHALTFVGYAAVAWLAVRWRPRPWYGPMLWSLLPAMVIVAIYSEPPLMLRMATLAAAIAGGAAGHGLTRRASS